MTEHIGFKVHVYPNEMQVLQKVFNHFDVKELTDEEQEIFYNFVDDFKDKVLTW
jgi:hypothetical protein